jgi:hypothetical protein
MCINNCNNNCNNTCNPQTNPCGCGTSTDEVIYSGPNLSCTGVQTCDSLTTAVSTIGEFLCSVEIVQIVINNITNNISLYNQFTTIVNNTVDCQTVWDCIESNTTTTTSTTMSPTTTTTTTILANMATCHTISVTGQVAVSWIDGEGFNNLRVINNETINICADPLTINTVNITASENSIVNNDIACTTNEFCEPTTTTTTTGEDILVSQGLSSERGANIPEDGCSSSLVYVIYVTGLYNQVFVNPGLTIPFNGGSLYWTIKLDDSTDVYTAQIDNDGYIIDLYGPCVTPE